MSFKDTFKFMFAFGMFSMGFNNNDSTRRMVTTVVTHTSQQDSTRVYEFYVVVGVATRLPFYSS